MPNRHHTFVRDEVLPSWWANAIQVALSTLAQNFRIERLSSTQVRVPAGPGDDLASIAIDGRWRWMEANVVRAHPGGAAGTYDVFVTASDNAVTNVPLPNTDLTDYAFDLAIVAHGATPVIVPGTVDLVRLVGDLDWDGASITALRQSVGAGIQDVQVAAGAAIAEAKLALASDAAAATPSRRSLGGGALQAAPGNHVHLPTPWKTIKRVSGVFGTSAAMLIGTDVGWVSSSLPPAAFSQSAMFYWNAADLAYMGGWLNARWVINRWGDNGGTPSRGITVALYQLGSNPDWNADGSMVSGPGMGSVFGTAFTTVVPAGVTQTVVQVGWPWMASATGLMFVTAQANGGAEPNPTLLHVEFQVRVE